nr:MAG TPA_asm: hypothetical protein [Caudoviricetes sp.]
MIRKLRHQEDRTSKLMDLMMMCPNFALMHYLLLCIS